MREVSFDEISIDPSTWKDDSKPFLDRKLTFGQAQKLSTDEVRFREDGYLIKKNLVQEPLIKNYCRVLARLENKSGYSMPCPYLHVEELRDICLYRPMMDIMERLVQNEMMLHLNLTGWVTTERDLHQDEYLNPPFVLNHYMAVWIALDDIHPDSGPFQYVSGSNWWPTLSQEKVFKIMKEEQGIDPSDPLWPTKTETWIAAACEKEIKKRGAKIETYLPEKGDVLFWSGRLLHRGSKANVPGMERKSLIAHYSSVNHRPDMKARKFHKNIKLGAWGFYFDSGMELEGDVRV